MAQAIKTVWGIGVRVDGRTAVMTGDVTMAKAIERGIQHATYYQAIYPEATITLDDISESCAVCYNEGVILPDKRKRYVRCPSCRGKGVHNSCEPITFRLSDDTSKVRLVQTAA